MQAHMQAIYDGMNAAAVTLVSLSIILFAGFLITRVTKLLRLPNVSGFIIAGLLIGPGALGLIPQATVDGMSFVSDIALTFIAFNVGSYFKREVIRSTGPRILIVTPFEALLAGALVFFAMKLLFGLSAEFSLLIAAIATATAPASTMMTVRQYRAKGPFVDALMQVVALDDVVCLFVYCIAAAIVSAEDGPGVWEVVLPVLWNIAALAVGTGCGFLLSKLLKPSRSSDNRLILAVAMLLGISGLCALVDISPLLSCMLFSAVYINRTDDGELFAQLNAFTPPIMSIFFVLSGMNLDLHALAGAGIIGAVYCVVRIAGKYLGAFSGCAVTHLPAKTRNWLGVTLIPQAGVAIGLAFLGRRLLPPEAGELLLTIILSSSVLYELIGPACAKAALFRSGAIDKGQLPQPEEKPNRPRLLRKRRENSLTKRLWR